MAERLRSEPRVRARLQRSLVPVKDPRLNRPTGYARPGNVSQALPVGWHGCQIARAFRHNRRLS